MSATNRTDWFWNDWRADLGVRRLTVAERGLWIDLLALAAEGSPFGYVTDSEGRSICFEEIARFANALPSEVEELIKGILAKGVASVDADGKLFNRRMARQGSNEAIASSKRILLQAKRREAGSKGGIASGKSRAKYKAKVIDNSDELEFASSKDEAIASSKWGSKNEAHGARPLPFSNKDASSFGSPSEQSLQCSKELLEHEQRTRPTAKPNGKEPHSPEGGELATAPLGGALRSPPSGESAEESKRLSEEASKPPAQLTRSEYEAMLLRRGMR